MRNAILGTLGLFSLLLCCRAFSQADRPQDSQPFIDVKALARSLESQDSVDRRRAFKALNSDYQNLLKDLRTRASSAKTGEKQWEDKEIAILLLGKIAAGDTETAAILADNLCYQPTTIHDVRPDDPLNAFPAAQALSYLGMLGLNHGLFPRVEQAKALDAKELELMAKVVRAVAGEDDLAQIILEHRKKSAKEDRAKQRYDQLLRQLQ
jgi:hypothetical protein